MGFLYDIIKKCYHTFYFRGTFMKQYILKHLIYIVLIFAGILFITLTVIPSYLSVTYNDEVVEFNIPQGSSLHSVAETLYDKGVIRSKLWFRHQGKLQNIDRNIKPGNYQVSPNISLNELFHTLLQGEQETPVIVTIPEGLTLYKMAERIESLGIATKEEFIESTERYFSNSNFEFETKELFFEMEGYLYPDTYYFSPRQTIDDIVAHMAETMQKVFTQEYLDRAEELNLTVHEVLTIASLIEKETYFDSERDLISGVIHNRLNIGKLLQIDAAIIYGIGRGEVHITRVLYSHLDEPQPFNTYKRLGLPPGPIGAPSKKSIHAALYPADHDYLFYVVGENGHAFSKTYAEHQLNVAKYRKMVNNN